MKIHIDDRVFIRIPSDAPEWLQDQMPATGSSGKAGYITAQAVWVNWGSGHEGWVPRKWLGGVEVLDSLRDSQN